MVDVNSFLSITSLVVSIFAIWLSWQFYSKGKDAEKNTALALEAIKTQTRSLENITGKMIEKLTRHATSPQKADEITIKMLELYTLQTTTLRVPSPDSEAMTAELISCYIAIYFYAGLANIYTQGYLPPQEQLEENSGIKLLVDQSNTDFVHMENVIIKIDNQRLTRNSQYNLYVYTQQQIKPYVRNSDQVYQNRASGESPETTL